MRLTIAGASCSSPSASAFTPHPAPAQLRPQRRGPPFCKEGAASDSGFQGVGTAPGPQFLPLYRASEGLSRLPRPGAGPTSVSLPARGVAWAAVGNLVLKDDHKQPHSGGLRSMGKWGNHFWVPPGDPPNSWRAQKRVRGNIRMGGPPAVGMRWDRLWWHVAQVRVCGPRGLLERRGQDRGAEPAGCCSAACSH